MAAEAAEREKAAAEKAAAEKAEAEKAAAEKAAAEKAAAEKAAAKPIKQKRTAKGYSTIEEYMEALVGVYLQELGKATSRTVKQKIQKLRDKGRYSEYEEEAIDSFGGHDKIAHNVYDYFKKKKYSDRDIKDMMKDAREEGYSMFNDIIDS
jgi:hypothetical protein